MERLQVPHSSNTREVGSHFKCNFLVCSCRNSCVTVKPFFSVPRYTRVSLDTEPSEESYDWHGKLNDPTRELSDSEVQTGYRLTWPLRTRTMKMTGAQLDSLVRSYPRLVNKAYVSEKQLDLRNYV